MTRITADMIEDAPTVTMSHSVARELVGAMDPSSITEEFDAQEAIDQLTSALDIAQGTAALQGVAVVVLVIKR